MTVLQEQYVERSEAPRYSYELSDEEMSRLVADLLYEREPTSDDRFVCYEVAGSKPAANLGRQIEREVFERFFEGNDAEGMHDAYGVYEEQSTFFIAIDTIEQKAVGALRIIHDGDKGFKTLNDVAEEKNYPHYIKDVYDHYKINEPSKCWDIATVAVSRGKYEEDGELKKYRDGNISERLYRMMWVASQKKNIEHYFSVIDETPYELMGYVGFPFTPLHDATWMSYIGSNKSLPVHGDAPTFETAVRQKEAETAQHDPGLYSLLERSFKILGHGEVDDSLMLR